LAPGAILSAFASSSSPAGLRVGLLMWKLILLLLVGLYAAWFYFVIPPSRGRAGLWGPRWLAVGASSLFYRFGCFWLNWTIDTEEAVKKGRFDPDKQYLMVWHPHGAFTIAAFYFFSHFAARSPMIFNKTLYCAVADLLLSIPGLAEYLLLCNARSANALSMNSILKTGACIALQPGGIHEQVNTDHLQEKVSFVARLGFVRLAIKHGVPLLPVYAFGENQLFPTSSWLRAFNVWFYNATKVGNLFIHGMFGIPVTPLIPNPLLLPGYKKGLHVRYGQAVDVGPPDGDPSEEKVQEVFQKYKKALLDLFDEHKMECLPPGVGERGLKVDVRVGSGRSGFQDLSAKKK